VAGKTSKLLNGKKPPKSTKSALLALSGYATTHLERCSRQYTGAGNLPSGDI